MTDQDTFTVNALYQSLLHVFQSCFYTFKALFTQSAEPGSGTQPVSWLKHNLMVEKVIFNSNFYLKVPKDLGCKDKVTLYDEHGYGDRTHESTTSGFVDNNVLNH